MADVDAFQIAMRLLESVGRRVDAEFYLALFREEPKEQFATISIDANVIRHAGEAVVLDLRVLDALGLTPVVQLGMFAPTEAAAQGAHLRRLLEGAGVSSVLFDASSESLCADVTQAARAGSIPIVAFRPMDGAGEERFARLGQMLNSLQTRKLIFLRRPGGFRQQGLLMPLVNLAADYQAVVASGELSRNELALLCQSRRLVYELVTHKLLIAVTSPLNLFRELFTIKGAGTLLRRGAVIRCFGGYHELDRNRLEALLLSSFRRPVQGSFFERPISRVYLEENYRGVAILSDTELGTYLSKFAVDKVAQGEGIGRDLWDQFAPEARPIFWRARANNPMNDWYMKLCDGFSRLGAWCVFWAGLPTGTISAAIEYARSQPDDVPVAG